MRSSDHDLASNLVGRRPSQTRLLHDFYQDAKSQIPMAALGGYCEFERESRCRRRGANRLSEFVQQQYLVLLSFGPAPAAELNDGLLVAA